MKLSFSGPFCFYFNRHTDAPRVWTIAAIDRAWEINVAAIDCHVPVESRYERKPQPADHSGPPAAWLEGTGDVYVNEVGRAVIVASGGK